MRSRFVDYQPTGKPLTLTTNDLVLFDLLQEYRYLPLTFIGELLEYGKTTEMVKGRAITRYPYLSVRLRRLRKDGAYIHCPKPSWNNAQARYRPAVYALTAKGEDALKDRGLWRDIPKTGSSFVEELGVCMTRASFALGAKAAGVSLVTSQQLIKHPAFPEATRDLDAPFHVPVSFTYRKPSGASVLVEGTYVKHDTTPFAVQVQKHGKAVSWFCVGVEFDCDTEGLRSKDAFRSSIDRHFYSILELLKTDGYRKHYGFPKASVLFVVIGKARMHAIMDRLDAITNGEGHERILFAYVPDYTAEETYPQANGSMLTRAWHRVGYPDYRILEALGLVS